MRRGDVTWVVGGATVAIVAVGVAIVAPMGLMALPVALGLWLFIRFPWARALFFVFGAMVVFQTSEGLSFPKLVYFAGVCVGVIFALARLRSTLQSDWAKTLKPALLGAGILVAWLVFVTFPVAIVLEGVQSTDWARDAVTYLLVGAGVLIGIDAATTMPLRWARFLTMAFGAIAGFGFMSHWIQVRGFGGNDTNQGLLSSMAGLALPLALALALALGGRGIKAWWLAAGLALLLSVLVTGTRTGVVLTLALAGIVGASKKMRIPLVKALTILVVGAIALLTALPVAGAIFSSKDFVQSRFEGILLTLQSGIGQDQSGAIRERAYGYATEIWLNHIFLGQGMGVLFPNPSPNSAPTSFSLDTPMTYLAKFGLLGTIAVLGSIILILITYANRTLDFPWLVDQTAVRGASLVWVCLLPLGVTTEDKGFAISICLAALLVGSARRESFDTAALAPVRTERRIPAHSEV